MSEQPTFSGMEDYPSLPSETISTEEAYERAYLAIDDTYVTLVMSVDYEQGDEGIFYPELFEAAVVSFQTEFGAVIDDETRLRIAEEIQSDCQKLAEHGFDEPFDNEDTVNDNVNRIGQ